MKTFSGLKQEKGYASLNILLSVVVMLFMIGLIIGIFSIMGAEVQQQVLTDVTKTYTNVHNTSTYYKASTLNATPVGVRGLRNVVLGTYYVNARSWVLNNCSNGSAAAAGLIPATNYTWNSNNGTLKLTAKARGLNNTRLNCSFSFVWSKNNSESNIIYTTYKELDGVPDWFGIIIVITAMVVLISLTALVINTIRGTGILGGVSGSGAGGIGRSEVGTA